MKITLKSLFSAALLCATMLISINVATAAPISWGPVTPFEKAFDLVNNGAVTSTGARADVTVNGIAFSDPGVALGTFPDSGAMGPDFNASTGDIDFDTLSGSHNWDGAKDSSTVTLNDLTANQVYTIQAFIVDNRDCCRDREQLFGDNDGGTPSAPVARGPGGANAVGTVGHTLFGTFTADSTSQDFTVSTSAAGLWDGSLNNGMLTGYVVSEGIVAAVPEPTTCILLGLAIASSLGMGRRRS